MAQTRQYTDEQGRIISASQWRLIERRRRVAKLYQEMLPRYATFQQLYIDIAAILGDPRQCKQGEEVYNISFNTVRNDLEIMGLVRNTKQSRVSNDIRK